MSQENGHESSGAAARFAERVVGERGGSGRGARGAARFPSLAYGSLGEPGRGDTPLVSVLLQHPNMLRISPSRSVDP